MFSPQPEGILGNVPSHDSPPRKTKKRIRNFTPDDRATHRVIEKQRREALNERFLELAGMLPALASVRRLSKSLIVNESILHHKAQRAERLAAASAIRALLAERDELLMEVNDWRALHDPTGMVSRQPMPVDNAVYGLLNVENEKFGSFPYGFGDNKSSSNNPSDNKPREDDQEPRSSNRILGDGDFNNGKVIHTPVNQFSDTITLASSATPVHAGFVSPTMSIPVPPVPPVPPELIAPSDVFTSTASPVTSTGNFGTYSVSPMPNASTPFTNHAILGDLSNADANTQNMAVTLSQLTPSPDESSFSSSSYAYGHGQTFPQSQEAQHIVPLARQSYYGYTP